jgi:hypothetical protein
MDADRRSQQGHSYGSPKEAGTRAMLANAIGRLVALAMLIGWAWFLTYNF